MTLKMRLNILLNGLIIIDEAFCNLDWGEKIYLKNIASLRKSILGRKACRLFFVRLFRKMDRHPWSSITLPLLLLHPHLSSLLNRISLH